MLKEIVEEYLLRYAFLKQYLMMVFQYVPIVEVGVYLIFVRSLSFYFHFTELSLYFLRLNHSMLKKHEYNFMALNEL